MSGSYNLFRIAGAFIVSLVCASHESAQSAPVPLVGPSVSAAGCLIQTDFVAAGKHNFALVALEVSNVVHYPSANTIKQLHESEAITVLNPLYFRNAFCFQRLTEWDRQSCPLLVRHRTKSARPR